MKIDVSVLAVAWGVVLLLVPAVALADPCKAIPDRGPAPAHLSPGSKFQGPVTYVGDGDSLCIGLGARPEQWVEVRVADFYAPELNAPGGREAKQVLERIVRGKTLACVAGRRSFDRIVADCRLGSASVGDLMRRAGVAEGGSGR